MCSRKGEDEGDIDKWIERAFDPLLHTAAQGEAVEVDGYSTPDEAADEGESDNEEYEVGRILNRKVVKGKEFYLVLWKGHNRKDATWEPKSSLDGCADLIQDYESGLRAAIAYPSLLQTLDVSPGKWTLQDTCVEEPDTCNVAWFSQTVVAEFKAYLAAPVEVEDTQDLGVEEATKAIEELIKKQKAKGTAADWLPGYLKEYEAVKRLRLRELQPAEAVKIRNTVLVPRLRMILESKRDGRRKGRLILQGFQEPYAWDGGISTDSPVAYMTLSTIRCLLARGGRDDVITSRDVSTALLHISS